MTSIQDTIFRKNVKLDSKFQRPRMRESQQQIFWRNHEVQEVRYNGKFLGWYGRKFPISAQEIINQL